MDKQVRLEAARPAWRSVLSHLKPFAITLATWTISALRLGFRLLALSRPGTWRFALFPIAIAVSLLIANGVSIAWWLVAAEAFAAICALSGWRVLRARRLFPQGVFPYLRAGTGLFVVAALATTPLLSAASATIMALGGLALALIALDLAPAGLRSLLPRAVPLVARLVVAPLLLGVGLVMVTALTQRAQPDVTLWLVGAALSLLVFAMIQAREMVVDGAIQDQKTPQWWRSPLARLAGALALTEALIVGAALPTGAPHGLLLALGTLPMSLVAVAVFWRSTFIPARVWASRRVGEVFMLATLALTVGALASALVASASAALMQALGG
jgi:hypothetical protein